MGVLDGRRHEFRSLQRGIAEHDALVTGAIAVHALRDVRGLLVDVIVNLDLFPMELLLLIADVAHAIADDAVDSLHHGMGRLFRGQADLAADHHAVRRGEGLACHAGVRLFGQEGIKDSIRDAVADFVGVALRDGLGRKDIVLPTGCGVHEKVLRLVDPRHVRKPLWQFRLRLDGEARAVNARRCGPVVRTAGRGRPATA